MTREPKGFAAAKLKIYGSNELVRLIRAPPLNSGTLVFVGRRSLIRVHHRCAGGWPVLVTLMGWLAILGGLIRRSPAQLRVCRPH